MALLSESLQRASNSFITACRHRPAAPLFSSRVASTSAKSRRRLKFDLAQPLTLQESVDRVREREARKRKERQEVSTLVSIAAIIGHQ